MSSSYLSSEPWPYHRTAAVDGGSRWHKVKRHNGMTIGEGSFDDRAPDTSAAAGRNDLLPRRGPRPLDGGHVDSALTHFDHAKAR
ncbi:hypothetical protein GCM10022247_29920 [Allokutzneria multivorans]|uniref:Uncharacterized protein n=1 Tax=Allokutzneria multivorans TaxID=1142134 RepID=A0ABP7S3R7_9PSEU